MEKDSIVSASPPGQSEDQQSLGKPEEQQVAASSAHGECCEQCKRTCRRNFWTEVLRTAVKVAGVVLAALGLSSFNQED